HPQVAYYEGTAHDLKYGTFNGVSWSTTTVDSANDAGAYQSIALSPSGNPLVAYSYFDGSMNIRYAVFDGTAWSISDVYQTSADGVGLILKRNGLPVIWARPNYLQFDGFNWTPIQSFNVAVESSFALDGRNNGHWSSYPNFGGIGFLQV